MARTWYFTSESVTEGHPDKLCDRISDRILDAILAQDKSARVACETTVTTGMCHIMGEITTSAQVDFAQTARVAILATGYTKEANCGFDGESCAVMVSLDRQSPDIAMGVDKASEAKEGNDDEKFSIGAGDQGMMFGYACDETPELMPLAVSMAHKLAKQLTRVRVEGILPYLRPDGKTQVTVQYEDNTACRIEAIVVSSQHAPDVSLEQIRSDIIQHVITPIVPNEWVDEKTKIFVNPTGRFVVGGPVGDSGLTGRKIIVDTYGGAGRHGGGAFSGKDPTKVDRSAAYAARYVAKQVVKAGLAKKCEVQLAYAIGVATPMSVFVDTFGTETADPSVISEAVTELFDLRPMAIIENFDLRRPIYEPLSAYGHMGREELNVPWEKTDAAEKLRALVLQKIKN